MIFSSLTETLFKKHIFGEESFYHTAYILAHEIRGSQTPHSTPITAPAMLNIPQLMKWEGANLHPTPSPAPLHQNLHIREVRGYTVTFPVISLDTTTLHASQRCCQRTNDLCPKSSPHYTSHNLAHEVRESITAYSLWCNPVLHYSESNLWDQRPFPWCWPRWI